MTVRLVFSAWALASSFFCALVLEPPAPHAIVMRVWGLH
jgi:hypothetical protein